MSGHLYTRHVPLDDIEVEKGGDGRTVTAYATVFDTAAEIRDQDGHYEEQIARTAFDKTLAERGLRFGVFYNHARTVLGTPFEQASIPLGSPIEIRPDGKGLLTRTRYNKTALAEQVLEAIRNGDIRGQSFTGRVFKSSPARGPYRSRNGQLTLVTRHEIGLKEYGPTPFPAYQTADITSVRAVIEDLRSQGAVDLDGLSDDEWTEITALVEAETARRSTSPDEMNGTTTPPGAGAQEEPVDEKSNHSSPARSQRDVRLALRRIGVIGNA